MKTGAELKARREELKITQHDLADKIGVSRTQLSRMENGKIEISSDIYMKIEAVLTSNEEYKEPELTINDIQVGDELECIDRDGFTQSETKHVNCEIANQENIVVESFSDTPLGITVNIYGSIGVGKINTIFQKELKYFRKKPKLQFSDLEVGDYVYVRDDLVDGELYGYWAWVAPMHKGCFIEIKGIINGVIQNNSFKYTPEMLDLSRSMKKEDYLKVNEKEIASFEELQYVANKALDESIIEKYEVCIGSYGNKNMIIHFDGKFTEYSDNSTNSGIKFIQSLYTEEFIIEKMADELKIKSGAQLILSNGMKCIYFDDGDRKLRHDGDFYPCNFLILKGATVKQSK